MMAKRAILRVYLRSPNLEPFSANTMNVKVPCSVGVPEITPVEGLRVRPAGRDPERSPELTDHVTPDTSAESEAVYSEPTIPDESVCGMMDMEVGELTVMLKFFVDEAVPFEALTVKLNVPETVGVPEITPAVLRERPPGKFPELISHEALLTEEDSCVV